MIEQTLAYDPNGEPDFEKYRYAECWTGSSRGPLGVAYFR